MYSSSRFLLEELFNKPNSDVNDPPKLSRFIPPDPTLRERLVLWLRLTAKIGALEYYSLTYLHFTIASILNLYDLSKDEEIVDLAERALLTLFSELSLCMDSQGFCFAASGRAILRHYDLETADRGIHQMLEIYFGFRKGFENSSVGFAPSALASSKIDLTPAISSSVIPLI